MLTVLLSMLVPPKVGAKPVVIYGDANGLWSPTHPHITFGHSKPRSPVLYQPPEPVIEEGVDTLPEVCPTLQSSPHLCEN
jgi:hypothetical protein